MVNSIWELRDLTTYLPRPKLSVVLLVLLFTLFGAMLAVALGVLIRHLCPLSLVSTLRTQVYQKHVRGVYRKWGQMTD